MGMNLFDEIRELGSSDSNPYLQKAIKNGRPAMGYFCAYIPEEILHAAGFTPYRMRAVKSRGTTKGDIYFSAINCTFVRHCFDKALHGDFNFLSGIIFMNGCDHTRRMYDNWRHADIAPAFRHMFIAPHKINQTAEKRYTAEMQKLISAIQEHFQVTISTAALKDSIELYNRRRKLLNKLQQLRLQPAVPIRGSEMLLVMLAITAMPVEDAILLLERLLAEMPGRNISREGDIRLYLTSGCIEEPGHLEMIERAGGLIVADNICLGQKHAGESVNTDGEPLQALSQRYLNQLSCPRMMNDQQRRIQNLKQAMQHAEATIAEKLKFCDLWGGELFILRQVARQEQMPLLALERELYGGGTGQLQTRLEAFFEQVRGRAEQTDDLVQAAGTSYKVRDN